MFTPPFVRRRTRPDDSPLLKQTSSGSLDVAGALEAYGVRKLDPNTEKRDAIV
jgi:hypothetical protein